MGMLLDLRRHFPLAWSMVRRCRLPEGRLGEPYYVSFEPGGGVFGEQWNAFDESGVLCKGVHNPVSIAQYALHCYDRLCAGDAASREPFLRHAAFLKDAQREDGTYVYTFAHRPYGLEPGWISCLAQGEAASVLFRAYALTSDRAYLQSAMNALSSYERDISDGGVSFIRGRDVFFEEVAGCPTHILNGHISACFALWEALEYGFGSHAMRELHEAAIETLGRWLPFYDDDGWSFYQLAVRNNGERHYAPITYHQAHINLLHVYAAMTGRADFEAMSSRWRDGLARWDVRARVWRDSAHWLTGVVANRVRKAPASPWVPMTTPAST